MHDDECLEFVRVFFLLGPFGEAGDGICFVDAAPKKFVGPALQSSYQDYDYSWKKKERRNSVLVTLLFGNEMIIF